MVYGGEKEDIEGTKRSVFGLLVSGLCFRVFHVLGGGLARWHGHVSQARTTLNVVLFPQSTTGSLRIVMISRYLPLVIAGVVNTC